MFLQRWFTIVLLTLSIPCKGMDYIIPDDDFDVEVFDESDCNRKQRVTVDILFIQDPKFGNMDNQTTSWVRDINTYFLNSGVLVNLRKVGHVLKKFSSTDFFDKLRELKNSSEIDQIRNRHRADYVMGISDGNGKDGVAGVGFLTIDPGHAFSMVKNDAGSRVAAHELGHNLGLGHSLKQESDGNPYKWGRGYGVPNKFATMMTYQWLYPAPLFNVFSNPDIQCAGMRCGVPENRANGANAARAINCVRFQVSRHR